MDHLSDTQHPSTGFSPADEPQTRWVAVAADSAHPAATAAYFRAQASGFSGSAEMRDWLLVIDSLSRPQL